MNEAKLQFQVSHSAETSNTASILDFSPIVSASHYSYPSCLWREIPKEEKTVTLESKGVKGNEFGLGSS